MQHKPSRHWPKCPGRPTTVQSHITIASASADASQNAHRISPGARDKLDTLRECGAVPHLGEMAPETTVPTPACETIER